MCLHGKQEVPRSSIPRDRSHKSVVLILFIFPLENKLLSSLQKCSVVEEFIKRMCLHGKQEVPRSRIPRDRSHKSVLVVG